MESDAWLRWQKTEANLQPPLWGGGHKTMLLQREVNSIPSKTVSRTSTQENHAGTAGHFPGNRHAQLNK